MPTILDPAKIARKIEGTLDKYLARLGDTHGLLTRLGAKMLAASHRSFRQQAMGSFEWAEQYPGQDAPFLHIAGAVTDLRDRGRIQSRRFGRTAALLETRTLFNGVNFQVSGDDTVELVITNEAKNYAALHNYGGTSFIALSDEIKRRIIEAIEGAKKATEPKKAKRKTKMAPDRSGLAKAKKIALRVVKGFRAALKAIKKLKRSAKRKQRMAGTGGTSAGRKPKPTKQQTLEAVMKLKPLLKMDTLTTQVNRRPFMGLAPEDQEDITEIVENWVTGGRRAG